MRHALFVSCNKPNQIGLYFQINLSNVILIISSILCTDMLLYRYVIACYAYVFCVRSSNIDTHKLIVKYNINIKCITICMLHVNFTYGIISDIN